MYASASDELDCSSKTLAWKSVIVTVKTSPFASIVAARLSSSIRERFRSTSTGAGSGASSYPLID
jgi:hypothetical protein